MMIKAIIGTHKWQFVSVVTLTENGLTCRRRAAQGRAGSRKIANAFFGCRLAPARPQSPATVIAGILRGANAGMPVLS